MLLLGAYKSQLSTFHYEQLVALLQQAVALGGNEAGSTFDTTAARALLQQAQDFGLLPSLSAGQRATDDSMNNPLDLLAARFAALLAEANDFLGKAEGLISVANKDTTLLDQVIAGASLDAWVKSKLQLQGSTQYAWDYSMGYGSISTDIPLTDPADLFTYTTRPPLSSFLTIADSITSVGIGSPIQVTTIPAKDFTWQYSTTGQFETLYGPDWTKLSLLENQPLLTFSSGPQVNVELPIGGSIINIFEITGSVTGGSLPIYVRVLFTPRRNQINLSVPESLSNGDFEQGFDNWANDLGWDIDATGNSNTGTQCVVKLPSDLPSYLSSGVPFDVKPADLIYLEGFTKSINDADGTISLQLAFLASDGSEVLDGQGNPVVVGLIPVEGTTAYSQVSGVVRVPSQYSSISQAILQVVSSSHTTGTWFVDSLRVHVPIQLSGYQVPQDEVVVYTPTTVYEQITDFVVDDSGQVTLLGIADGTNVIARFTELFPAYQCSVNEIDWSALTVLDPNRPYPDNTKVFLPITFGVDPNGLKTRFPLTDELGNATGLYIRMLNQPQYEYYMEVTTPPDPNYGANATLQIDFSRPSYMNGISLSPFSTYPLTLKQILVTNIASNTPVSIFQGAVTIDKPISIRFDRRLVRTAYLVFYQQNYEFKQHTIAPTDAIRREVITNLQAVLPLAVQQGSEALPIKYTGAQYEFGLENINGQDWTASDPGVIVAGPYRFTGVPEVVKLDADIYEDVNLYLCFLAYNGSNVLVDVQLQGITMAPGECTAFPFASTLNLATVDHVDLYLKVVNRSDLAILERFLLQVTAN